MPVIAKQTCRIAGSRDVVVQGRLYDDGDPVVRQHPWLFATPEEAVVAQQRPRSTADLGERSASSHRRAVEQATDAPGELRDTGYVCERCGHRARSEHGLTVHRGKAHK